MYIRYCPTCHNKLQYKSLPRFNQANKLNKSCYTCAIKARSNNIEWKNNLKKAKLIIKNNKVVVEKIKKPNGNIGKTRSQECKNNISKSLMNRKLTIEHKQNISKATKNRTFTPEHIQKLRNAQTNMYYTKETRLKMSQSRLQYMNNNPSKYTSSKSEIEFLNILEQIYNIKIIRSFLLEDRIFDGKYNDIIIEIDGEYWHNQKRAIINDEYKTSLVYKNKYKLLRIKLNSCKEIDNTLIKYKSELDKCFYKPS